MLEPVFPIIVTGRCGECQRRFQHGMSPDIAVTWTCPGCGNSRVVRLVVTTTQDQITFTLLYEDEDEDYMENSDYGN